MTSIYYVCNKKEVKTGLMKKKSEKLNNQNYVNLNVAHVNLKGLEFYQCVSSATGKLKHAA